MTGGSHGILNDGHAQDWEMVKLALESAQVGIWDWDLVTGLMHWNREHEQLFGLPDNSFDGRYETFDRFLHPDDREPMNQAIQQAIQGHGIFHHEFRIIWADGSLHWIESRGNAIYDEAGQPLRMMGTVVEIDERKQAQLLLQQQFEQQQLIIEISQRIRQSLNLQDILQTAVDEVRQFLHVDRVIIFQFLADWHGKVTVESCGANWTAILSAEIYDPCFHEHYVETFKQGMVTAKADIQTAGIDPCHFELLSNFQVRANLVVPIMQADKLWGLLIAHHCEAPRQWQNSEINLLRQLAAQVGIALQQATLFEQVQTELLERKQAEAALHQSEQRYRMLFESIDEGFCVVEMLFDENKTPFDYRFLEANPAFGNQTGLQQVVGKTARQLMPNLEDYWFEAFGRVALTGEPIRFEKGAVPLNRWFDVYAFRLGQPASQKVALVFQDITQRKQAEIALQSVNSGLEQRVSERTAELTAINDR
ncbi:MAG: GAF domain-containing protein, partial [Kovacikia sp.]